MSLPRRAALAAMAAVLIGAFTPGLAGATTPPARYVALGDSFTSSPLTGLPTGHNGLGCTRSHNNYPHLVQNVVRAGEFADVSCGGARTDHLYQPQTGPLGGTNPPQLNAVTAATTLVTLSFGGNDIGFGEIIENCLSLLPFGTPCRNRYVVGGVDQLAARIVATAPKIDRAIAEVRSRAPGAEIWVIGYPAIVPDSGPACWSPILPVTDGDAAYLRATEKRLNQMLAERATAGGARYADTYTPSIGHDACRPPGVKWVEGLIPLAPAAPIHPNALGSRGMADGVLAAMLGGPAQQA
jgi:lysophospholipase L1-like esterase